jgi:hypothetical protein
MGSILTEFDVQKALTPDGRAQSLPVAAAIP